MVANRVSSTREIRMKSATATFAMLLVSAVAAAQRPSDPALLVPQTAPPLNYTVSTRAVELPPGVTMGAPASVAFDAKGHMLVLTRGAQPFFEFDERGSFIRAFGDGLFVRAHGLQFDADGNIWATDVGAHVVYKLDTQGQVQLTLGTKGAAGEWNEATGSRKLNEPNDVAFSRNGDVFVVQGHTPGPGGDARVLKFDKQGRFVKSWGGKGKGTGRFDVAHAVAVDAQGRLWVADRENQRIQIFDAEGTFIREIKYAGLPCGLEFKGQYLYMVNGFAGQILRLDLSGKVLAATGKAGTGAGEFGEAHAIAVSPKGDIYVADPVNSALLKFVQQ
jgi:DNA-binding beta-propeller fold protein YncE